GGARGADEMAAGPGRDPGWGGARPKQPDGTLPQPLPPPTLEQVGTIPQPQLQPLARDRDQAQRIVRGIVTADLGQPQPAIAGDRAVAEVDRIVLEHHQGVEQLAQAAQALDLGQAQMLVRNQARLALLHLPEQNRY